MRELLIPYLLNATLIVTSVIVGWAQNQPVGGPAAVKVGQAEAEAHLISSVQPQYPAKAREKGIQGTVMFRAIVGKDGSIDKLYLLSGHPLLVSASIDPVKQWKYKPFVVNGEPIEAEIVIAVNFQLQK